MTAPSQIVCPSEIFRCLGCGRVLAELHGRRFCEIGPALFGEEIAFTCTRCRKWAKWKPTGQGEPPPANWYAAVNPVVPQ